MGERHWTDDAYEYCDELEGEIFSLREQLAKANERVRELEKNQLPAENGKNRYALDVSYFRNAINRELNRPLDNYKPDELARVFARLSRTADESVMFEPEFSSKFALEKKVEALKDFFETNQPHIQQGSAKLWRIDNVIVDSYIEQLRKDQAQCK
jgi:uncharacterized coiled-coil DUF342 family protein